MKNLLILFLFFLSFSSFSEQAPCDDFEDEKVIRMYSVYERESRLCLMPKHAEQNFRHHFGYYAIPANNCMGLESYKDSINENNLCARSIVRQGILRHEVELANLDIELKKMKDDFKNECDPNSAAEHSEKCSVLGQTIEDLSKARSPLIEKKDKLISEIEDTMKGVADCLYAELPNCKNTGHDIIDNFIQRYQTDGPLLASREYFDFNLPFDELKFSTDNAQKLFDYYQEKIRKEQEAALAASYDPKKSFCIPDDSQTRCETSDGRVYVLDKAQNTMSRFSHDISNKSGALEATNLQRTPSITK